MLFLVKQCVKNNWKILRINSALRYEKLFNFGAFKLMCELNVKSLRLEIESKNLSSSALNFEKKPEQI